MENISTTTLSLILVALIVLSGFFSSSETGMMSLNRYRLKNLAKKGNKGALLTQKLLARPDRLIGLILIGNNFVNILAASIATVICVRIWGDLGIAIATLGLTIVILIFAEVTPKTLAALHPEKIAYPASFILTPLYKVCFIFVWGLNAVTNGLLKLVGVNVEHGQNDNLNSDELKIIVSDAGALIPKRHQNMLLSVLDLEKVTVEDIMIPRNEVTGVDLELPIDEVISQMRNAVHTRLPVYRDEIDNVEGFLHSRQIIKLLAYDDEDLTKELILEAITPVYFIPEGTPLNTQLLNFQRKKLRIGLVVDEYGDILGLATLEDILEEIVGEFTTDFADTSKDIQKEKDGSIIIDGSATIRDINRSLDWTLPTDGPKTLNGLILEYIEAIPQAGTGMRLSGYPMEILQVKSNMIKSVRVWPELHADQTLDIA
ncbi:HlyC/CorC family transporter [Aliikangiella coralliicola]|uniref:HlyC/CorC family transporter n=1 Tax=Aliikangiella coralliicola TaxID=2592383 RepID=A0A545UAT4_9GAMM|nr:HlyC/CorC family transporter [Aliikangiella coralliicola]TQV86576.1 HlyC/CorC family transporter [Aliikangiella coralliicola]